MKSSKGAAVGYSRVSTLTQVRGASLETQRAYIKAWCSANGHRLAGLHTDDGLSGKRTANRPGLAASLRDVCQSRGTLVVYSLSRLARSTRDAIDICEKLQRCGADLVSLTEHVDTRSATGRLFFTMLSALAQFEADLTSERTAAALAHLRAQGRRTSRFPPMGYRFKGQNLVEVPHETAVVKRILSLRAKGASLREIAARMVRDGVRTKRGGQWTAATVQHILRRAAKVD